MSTSRSECPPFPWGPARPPRGEASEQGLPLGSGSWRGLGASGPCVRHAEASVCAEGACPPPRLCGGLAGTLSSVEDACPRPPAIVSRVLCPCSDLKLRVRILIDGTLIIFRVKPEDAGKYTCVPSNSLGRSPSASAYLTVQCEWGRRRPRWPHGGLEGCVEAAWAEEGPRRGRDSAGGGLTRAGQRR